MVIQMGERDCMANSKISMEDEYIICRAFYKGNI